MGDVFLSYSQADAELAQDLVDALASRGQSVWWDKHLSTGQQYHDVIGDRIAGATCVVVLWSHESVQSRWVKGEAEAAATKGILIPAAVEPLVEIPVAFLGIHTADLTLWRGKDHAHPGVDELLAAIAGRTGTDADSSTSLAPVPGARLPYSSISRTELALMWALGLMAVMVAAVLTGLATGGAAGGWIGAGVLIFGLICFASIALLFEGLAPRPSFARAVARTKQRQLRWIALLAFVGVVVVAGIGMVLAGRVG